MTARFRIETPEPASADLPMTWAVVRVSNGQVMVNGSHPRWVTAEKEAQVALEATEHCAELAAREGEAKRKAGEARRKKRAHEKAARRAARRG